LDRLQALAGRIEPIFHVNLGHTRGRVANCVGLHDCCLRVGYSRQASSLQPSSGPPQRAICRRAPRRGSARVTSATGPASEHHQATGPRATVVTSSEPALVPHDSEATRLPPTRVNPRPDTVQPGPVSRTLVPRLAASVPHSCWRSVSRHPSQYPPLLVAHWPSVAC
jgi:hypothetical protein